VARFSRNPRDKVSMVKPKPTFQTEVLAQESRVRRFDRSLRIQEHWVLVRLRSRFDS
jgi:hypothetical protein